MEMSNYGAVMTRRGQNEVTVLIFSSHYSLHAIGSPVVFLKRNVLSRDSPTLQLRNENTYRD